MSSFIKKIKNPSTKKMQKAYYIDDYYGSHIYGVAFRKDCKDASWDNKINFKEDCDVYREEEL